MPIQHAATLTPVFVSFLCAGAMAHLWARVRKNYLGPGWWAAQLAGQTVAFTLLYAGWAIPSPFASAVGNATLTVSMIALAWGMDDFTARWRESTRTGRLPRIDAILGAVAAVAIVGFWMVGDQRIARYAMVGAMGWYGFRVIRTLLSCARPVRAPDIAFAVTTYGLFFLAHGAKALIRPEGTGTLFVAVLASLSILMSLAQALLISGRLVTTLSGEREKYRSAFDLAPFSIVLSRLSDGRILDVNRRLCDLSGYREEELLGRTDEEIGGWVDPEARTLVLAAVESGGAFESDAFEFRRRDGITVPAFLSSRKIDYEGMPAMITVLKDISEFRRMARKMEEMATLDMLTGLPNRRYFYDFAVGAMARTARAGDRLALITVNLDDFKRINEIYGHTQGDQIIVEAGRRVKEELREGDTLARFAGDEFVAVLEGIKRDADVTLAMERVMKAFERPFEVAGIETRLGCSQGAATYPTDAEDIDRLIAVSGAVLFRVKTDQKGGYDLATRQD